MPESPRFSRNIENFVCLNCGQEVSGNGYTNHCPVCLYSRHVDINPGDRASQCLGVMQPRRVEAKAGGYVIWHHCLSCGVDKPNRSSRQDSFDSILEVMRSARAPKASVI